MIEPITGNDINRRVIFQPPGAHSEEEGSLVGTTDDPDFVQVRFVYMIPPHPDSMVKVVRVKREYLRWVAIPLTPFGISDTAK